MDSIKENKTIIQAFTINAADFHYSFFRSGLEAIMVLYLIKQFGLSNSHAFSFLGVIGGLTYTFPIFIAYLTENFFTRVISASLGLMMIALGFLLLGSFGIKQHEISLALITCGYVLGRPNLPILLSEVVQAAQNANNIRILYVIGNIASFLSPLVFSWVLFSRSKEIFIGCAILSICMSLLCFSLFYQKEQNNKKSILKFIIGLIILSTSVLLMGWLLKHPQSLPFLTIGAIIISLFYIIKLHKRNYKDNLESFKYLATVFVISVLFFMLVRQEYFLLPLYIEHFVNKNLFGFEIPTPWFNSLNPIFVIILTPFLSLLDKKLGLENYKKEKMLFIIFTLASLGFSILTFGIFFKNFTIPFIVLAYFIFTLGELLLVPFALHIITSWNKKSDKLYIMGLWYMSMAIAKMFSSGIGQAFDKMGFININHISSSSFLKAFALLTAASLLMVIASYFLQFIRRKTYR